MDNKKLNKLNSLFDAISIISEGAYVYLCDLSEDYSRWSESAVDYFGLPDKYMVAAGDIWYGHIHPDDKEEYKKNIDDIFNGTSEGHDMQYRARARDGSYVFCTCRGVVIKDENGNPEYFGGAIMNHGVHTYTDPVTGLRNLYGFFDDLSSALSKNKSLTTLMIGLNSFSDVNDMYGYSFGNKILCKLGNIVQTIFKDYGELYKLDGTKYALSSAKLSDSELKELYSKLQAKIKKGIILDNIKVNLSVNAGAVICESSETDHETLYSCVKYAYYESKHSKMGELVFFDNSQSSGKKHTLEKLNAIRDSISDDYSGFYLLYQPIVDAKTEKLKNVEALIRWRNDEFGDVMPNDFIPVLEQDNLFPDLGKWIIRTAVTEGKRLLEKFPDMVMNVNLSYVQLEKGGFVADVMNILQETGYPAGNLCFEITERCRILDINLLKMIINSLREVGIRVALDDFGIGFSAIGVLRELSVDTVKIDRLFVKNIETSSTDQRTIRFISDLAGSFSAEVCVEGIETAEMRDLLRQFNVSGFQGYYYSKPVTADEIIRKMI